MWVNLLFKLADLALPIIISAVKRKLIKEKGYIGDSDLSFIEKAKSSHNELKYLYS